MRLRRSITAALLAVALVASGAGCAPEPQPNPGEAEAVRESVRAYNEALVRAFAEFDMNELNVAATKEQAEREFYLMAALGEARVQMVATLTSVEFGEVTFPAEGQASVTTEESWDYDHVSLDTSETVRQERGVEYRLRYDLVLQDGHWLVDAVTPMDVSPSEETTP